MAGRSSASLLRSAAKGSWTRPSFRSRLNGRWTAEWLRAEPLPLAGTVRKYAFAISSVAAKRFSTKAGGCRVRPRCHVEGLASHLAVLGGVASVRAEVVARQHPSSVAIAV